MNQTVKTHRRRAARKLREAVHGAAYCAAAVVPSVCVYCGREAKGTDHVPALAVASWWPPQVPRLLFPACGVCNVGLSAYPSVCLVERSEYLVCVLRREWIRKKAGQSKRWNEETIVTTGRAVKDRLRNGATRTVCQCAGCARVLVLVNPLPGTGTTQKESRHA